jgi:HAE1 family hydrophobic/amphiphilic exporter-1
VFLRNVPATLIPSVTVPLALLGTAGGMYLLGYSRDNLSLMALTIAVGFVVDDAIVMLENIYRHVEAGMSPLEAALQGAGEIAFTIVSISVSLVAVFIPLLLMGGIVGRLFREFAVTVTLTIAVSVIVSLTLTPMLCSRFLQPHDRPTPAITGGSTDVRARLRCDARAYRRGLDHVLDHQFLTLCVFLLTVATTVVLFVIIPKGFFPQQDTGFVFGTAESAQDASFKSMNARMVALADVVRSDPDVSAVGMTGGQNTVNTGNFFIALRPRRKAARPRPTRSSRGCGRSWPRWRAPTCSCRPDRTSTLAGGCRARSTSTRSPTPTSPNSTTGRRASWSGSASCRNWPTWPPTSRTPQPRPC